jgi:hypothetical protein
VCIKMGLSLKLQVIIDAALVGLGAMIAPLVTGGVINQPEGAVLGVIFSTVLQWLESGGTLTTAKVGA